MTQLRRMVWLAVFIVAVLLPPSAFATTPPSLSISPASIVSGAIVTVSGSFTPNSSIIVWLDTNGNGQLDLGEPAFYLAIQTGADGKLPAIPWPMIDIPAGSFSVQAGSCPQAPVAGACLGTIGLAQAQITVNLGVSRSKFGSGTTVTVSGFGFSHSSTVNVWYDNNPSGTFGGGNGSATPSADSTGAFTTALLVSGNPGSYFIHASTSTSPQFSVPVDISTCWFQECMIDDHDTICILGNAPTDLQFGPVHLARCKQVNTDYTEPTPVTQSNNPPGGYDLSNVGTQFFGASVLAAATNDLGPVPTGCAAITSQIASAEVPFGNTVPDALFDLNKPDNLVDVACGGAFTVTPPQDLALYAAAHAGQAIPDYDFLVQTVLALGGPAAPPPAQIAVANAAVAGAIACGHSGSSCNGSDITQAILQNPALQTQLIPLSYLQPPIATPPNPNPCAAAIGLNVRCWGDVIGWAMPVCHDLVTDLDAQNHGVCERADTNGNFSKLPVPGSAGPNNIGATIECATGTVTGLSIGYDGDVSFDVNGPDVLRLVNYHNLLPGPGGVEPPNGLDIEIPLTDRAFFMPTIQSLRPGMTVHVCGYWVADMHMLWNELHPALSLSILVAPLTITANNVSRQYGQANPAFTVSYSGFVNGDTPAVLTGVLTCSSPATPASPVNGNPYPINCSGLSSSNTTTTYAPITYVPGLLTTTPAPLSLTANDVARAYHQANPAFTGVLTGIQNGDNITAIYSSSATISSPVGQYAIVPTLADPGSKLGNYSATVKNGTLTVNPAGAGANGTIVFRYSGSLDTMNPDGTRLTNVATPPVRMSYQDPAWSRDGKRIAFISGDPTGTSSLNVMNADGSGLTALTTSTSGFSHPTWSPDGKQIAVALQVGFFTTSIGVINADGSGGLRTLLSTSSAFFSEPAWSPDGTKIALAEQDLLPGAGSHIALANADGTGLTPVTSGKFDTSPTWAPDGTLIAFVNSGQIYRINFDGTFLTKLSNGADNDGHPRWSPDGTRIVFGTSLSGVDIWTMSAVDGSGRVPLTSCDCADSPDWQLLPLAVGNTPIGQNITVAPVDTTTGTSPVTVTFNSVTQAGMTMLTTSATGTPPPSGFEVGGPTVYYDISTTAAYTPPVTVCIHYNGTTFFGSSAPHVFHFENGLWVDRTSTVDTVNMIACGVAPSLSPFALFAPQPVLTITANNATRPYGAADPPFTPSASGLLNGDTLPSIAVSPICGTSATAASPAGTYPITCSGPSSATNYTITYSAGTLTITQAALSITANNASRLYGSPNPAFAASAAGLVNGDTLSSIGANPTCGTTATTASPVGSYAITCSGPSSTTNYAITYSAGTLTITQAALTVTANNATRLYGSPNPAFSVSTSGLVNGDTLSSIGATPTCITTAAPASPVGSYAITCSGPSSTTNYALSYQPGTLSITPAVLTITANNASKILNAPNPALSGSYSGFVNGDMPSSLMGTLTCTTTATTTSAVGSYPITCSGQTSANYAITYVPGTLKIMYAPAGVCGHMILPPINADGSLVGRQGRTIPAKFQVCDANGVSIGTPGVVSSFFLTQVITGTATTNVEDIVDTNNPDTAFRWDGQQWIFNITTQNLAAGSTYVYTISLNDGSTIMFQYGLR